MKALLFHGRRDIRIEDIPRPIPKDDEVLIKVTDAGLSQTQINEFIEGPFILSAEPHPLTGLGLPLIPCQEYGGNIVEVGKQLSTDLLGKMVAVLPLVSCGRCEYCLSGRPHYCPDKAYHGLAGLHGGFCEYTVANIENIIEVDDKAQLTFVEPLLVAVHSYHRYWHSVQDKKILIMGAGAIGLSCAAVWQKMGANQLTIYDNLPNRLATAKDCGLNIVENLNNLDGVFDIVIDAAGKDPAHKEQALDIAHKYLKTGGTVLLIGTYFFPIEISPAALLVEEKSYWPSYMYNEEDVKLLKELLPQLDFPFEKCIKRVGFDNIVQEGYYQAELDKDSFVRIVTNVE